MELRKEFVFKAMEPGANLAALCRDYGISRKTGYKWLERFKKSGADGLRDESRRPHGHPLEASAEVVCEIVRYRHAYPNWGPKKIRELVVRSGQFSEVPSVRTVARVLDRVGLVKKAKRRRILDQPAVVPAVEVKAPNDLWTVDFKGWWRTQDGRRCEPLTVRDAHSRYLLCVQALPGTGGEAVRETFEALFQRYGLPRAIQSDNGSPFACTSALGGFSRLSAWWKSLGIELYRGRPGCPQDNGGHERMHGDMRIELQDGARAPSLDEQQAACDVWRHTFNEVRPHEALEMKTPASVYQSSERRYELRVMPSVPADCETRTVDYYGRVKFYGQNVFLSRALFGHHVGFRPLTDGRWEVWFYDRLLAHYSSSADRNIEPVARSEKTQTAPGGDEQKNLDDVSEQTQSA